MKVKILNESKKLNESFPLKSVIDWDNVAYSINNEIGDDFLISIHEEETSRMMGGKISVLFDLIEVGNTKKHYRGFFTTSGNNESVNISMNVRGSLTGTDLGDATSSKEIADKLIDFVKSNEGNVKKLKETWSRPWDGLKGQEKLDAIKKFCAENPSLDPARVLCSNDGLARVEEEPIIIGDYKFVQDGRAWDVYRNDKFLYTGTRAAVCRQISDLWEKDMPLSTSEKTNENISEDFEKFHTPIGDDIEKIVKFAKERAFHGYPLVINGHDVAVGCYGEDDYYISFYEDGIDFSHLTEDDFRKYIENIEDTYKKGEDENEKYLRDNLPDIWKTYNKHYRGKGTASRSDFFSDYYKDIFGHRPRSDYQIERECQQLAQELGITLSDDIQEDVDVRSGIEKRVARDIANETEIPEDFVYQCFDSWKKFGFNLKSGEPVDTEELKWLVISEYNRA